MTSGRPVLFIGMDGVEPELIRRWMRDGSLPSLARLCREGVSGDVETLPGMGDGAVWPTLVTGVTPARHGRYFRRQLRPRSYRKQVFDVDTHLRYPAFWQTLSDAGRRVAVLDLPYSPSTGGLNGPCLVDWHIHDRYGPMRGHPKEFVDAVRERFGDDPIDGNSDRIGKDGASISWLLTMLIERIRQKQELVAEVISGNSWDFAATAFTEAHDIGHVGWHLHDPGHRRFDAAWHEKHGDPLKAVYAAKDAAIGKLVACADPEAAVIVFIGLGMGPNYTANQIFPAILDRLDGNRAPVSSGIAKRLRSRRFPAPVIRAAGLADRCLLAYKRSRRRYFALGHNENSGAIRINLKGREPFGQVAPSEYDAVCDELSEAMMELVNPATGIPVVSRVVRVAKEFEGERLDAIPDLFVVWNRESPFEAVESPRVGRIEHAVTWGRTGDHSPNAMLIARCAGVTAGELRTKPRVVDVAPTIGALLGVPLPGLDGRPIQEIASTGS